VLQWNWSHDHPDGLFKPSQRNSLQQIFSSGKPMRIEYPFNIPLPKTADSIEDVNPHLLRIEQSHDHPWTEDFGDELLIALDTVCQVLGMEIYCEFLDRNASIDEYDEGFLNGNQGITLCGTDERNGGTLFNTIILDNQTKKQSNELLRLRLNYLYNNAATMHIKWRIHDTKGILISSGKSRMDLNGYSKTPDQYALYQNYPNPFNASTIIRYQLPVYAQVKMEIYNILGKRVATLINVQQEAGYHQKLWNVIEPFNALASGVYFIKLEARGNDGTSFIKSQKLIVLK
jgi:hypothetical protein